MKQRLPQWQRSYRSTACSSELIFQVIAGSCVSHCTFDDDLIFLAVSTKTVEWYTENLDNYFTERPLDLANVMRNNALRLFPNLGKTKVERQPIISMDASL